MILRSVFVFIYFAVLQNKRRQMNGKLFNASVVVVVLSKILIKKGSFRSNILPTIRPIVLNLQFDADCIHGNQLNSRCGMQRMQVATKPNK